MKKYMIRKNLKGDEMGQGKLREGPDNNPPEISVQGTEG